ncbi:hypothetical protein ITP53_19255 [Nonomuraea sp. K274]|uniref:Wadjet protein JetD C-terminal domain-containing protein n=1 Tax=Nonomuraea cypriaca TaxID=1187855 RepID=A0A931AC45_9ACTN|nr:Wadjet anti-phage system protein JetD domain-containing protein [Nonomuraea cypriaca]MBF8187833.1 hypothetical protein [Nonomuraea cypriaca]
MTRTKLPQDLADWACTDGGAAFCAALRKRIYNGGSLDKPMDLAMTARQRADILDLFGTASVSERAIHLGRADQALLDSAYSTTLRHLLIGVGGPLRTKRGQARYQRIAKKARILYARADLHRRLEDIPELANELALLTALGNDTRWLPPNGTVAATKNWNTYAAALNAAAEWARGRNRGWKFAERELAVRALGGSKKWTDSAKAAFSRLIATSFEEAVYTADTGIRMLGPLSWKLSSLVADASAARPFVALPGTAAATQGILEVPARGILLIENQETFQALSRTPIHETWLCIWMEGYASDALAYFLAQMPDIPIAAWGDLDPPGIEIILNLQAKSGRTIHPVAMDADLYGAGYMLDEDAEDRMNWCRKARDLATRAPKPFQALAQAIARNDGYRCEQEGLHELVLPSLLKRLDRLRAVTVLLS